MHLRDGVLQVRNALGELNPWLFTDADIVRDLNLSARGLVSAAQSLRATYEGATTVGDQEYLMPSDMEQPLSGKIKIGILYPLTPAVQNILQVGPYIASVPFANYWRRGILRTGQTSDSGEEIIQPAPPQGAAGWILGLSPVPGDEYPFWIDYFQYHPQMNAPMDLCLLPDMGEFMRYWASYAIARGKEKESDFAAAEDYDGIYMQGKLEYKNYFANVMLQAVPPHYGTQSLPDGPQVSIVAPTASNLSVQ